MKNFIEVTTIKDETIFLNVNHIFEVSNDKKGTIIKITVQGHNDFAYQYHTVKNAYDEIKALINNL